MSKEEKIVTERYYVDGIVCDWGVFDRLSYEEENKLVCICNSHKNALTIAEILNTDYYPDEKGYVSVWEDKQLAELKEENERLKDVEQHKSFVLYSALHDVLAKDNDENVASAIDQMTKQDNGELCEMYKDYQNLKAENEKLKENNTTSYLVKLFDDENKTLKQQLKEKDEEIKKWKHEAHKACLQMEEFQQEKWDLQDKLKSNTKQVCEKIRERITLSSGTFANAEEVLNFKKFLDQIEKGEDNDKR